MPARRCIKGCGRGVTPARARQGKRTCAACEREARASSAWRAYERHLQVTYGLSGDDYLVMLDYQGGRCYICKRATGKKRRLAVDHDHATGIVRGLLCRPCNRFLGHIRDHLLCAVAVAKYLECPPAARALGREAKVPDDRESARAPRRGSA